MDHDEFWLSKRGNIISAKGGWRIGEAVYNHGYSMMDELIGKVSYFQLLLLNVTGTLPELRLALWLESSYMCMSWPDARIWCNQIGALAGSARTKPSSGCVAGVLASDSLLYGPGSLPACMKFICSAFEDKKLGLTVDEIVEKHARWVVMHDGERKPQLPGYARPVAKGDERVKAMLSESRKLGFSAGLYEKLSLEIAEYLRDRFQEDINIGGYSVAFLADQGITNTELYRFSVNRVAAGVQACYTEAADNPAESFLPLTCDDIDYVGVAPRELPKRS
jgi:hypothetical protein